MKCFSIKLKLILTLCLASTFIGCKNDDIEGFSKCKISIGDAKLETLDDVGVAFLQLELTAPLEENCAIWLKCEEAYKGRFSFPEYIVLGKGAVRGKYPIYINESKYPIPDRIYSLSIAKVGAVAELDTEKNSCAFTVLGKDNVGKVFISFEEPEFNIGEDKGYCELPFLIEGVLAKPVTVEIEYRNGSAIESVHYKVNKDEIELSKGQTWNYIPMQIFDDNESSESRNFHLEIKNIVGDTDSLVFVDQTRNECTVNILDVVRKLEVRDSLVEIPEYANKIKYAFNLTAPVPQDVTAKVRFKEGSTAIEGTHFIMKEKEITIEAGETLVEVEVDIINDNLGNVDRSAYIELYDVVGIELSDEKNVGILTIENDDTTVGFGIENKVMWSGSNLKIPLTVEGIREEPLLVKLEAISGTAEVNKDFILLFSDIRVNGGDSVFFAEISAKNMTEEQMKNLRLKITTVKGLGISTNARIDPNRMECSIGIAKSSEIAKARWSMISCNSQEESDPGTNLFDGDINTIWHTHWSEGEDAPPYISVIDLGEAITFDKIVVYKRQNRPNDARHTNLYISNSPLADDSPDWIKIGEDTNDNSSVKQNTVQINNAPIGRYLKVEITKGRGDGATTVAGLGEIDVFGGKN